MNEQDLFLLGLDRKKHPEIIWKAYNTPLVKVFFENLLTRINKELGGNINVDKFCHYTNYNPLTGRATSYLVSLEETTIKTTFDNQTYHLKRNEVILTNPH